MVVEFITIQEDLMLSPGASQVSEKIICGNSNNTQCSLWLKNVMNLLVFVGFPT